MTLQTLINRVMDKYYHNNFMEGPVGGTPESGIMLFLIAITNTIDVELHKARISEVWIGEKVTWFTRDLPSFTQLPKFPGETDATFLQRMIDFSAAQELGGNSTDTLRAIVYNIVGDAVASADTDITIVTSSVFNEWKDELETEDARWGENFLWADTDETLRSIIKIQIRFQSTGSSTDPLNYEYWELSQNFTKIQDAVNLFISSGITFELELIAPTP